MAQRNEVTMSDYPLYVAFYFDRAPKFPVYTRGAERLAQRCKELDITIDITKLDLFEYMAAHKARNPRLVTDRNIVYRFIPIFIMDMLKKHNCPLLYIHCDSLILRKPNAELFEPGMSIGYSAGHTDSKLKRVFASPLFFRPDRSSLEFLGLWNHMCQSLNTDRGEHMYLGATINTCCDYPELRPFKGRISSENKLDDPDILYGQGLTRSGEIA